MSELQLIEAALRRTARRRRWQFAWHGFWRGLAAGGLLWLVVFAAYKLFPLPVGSLIVAAGVAALLPAGGAILGAGRRISLLATARWLDGAEHLQERLSTALEMAPSPGRGNWKDLLIKDAARCAGALDPAKLLPLRWPAAGRWALISLILSAGLGFVPEYRSPAHRQKAQDAAHIRDTGRQLSELVRQDLKQRPPVLEPTQKAMEAVAELGEQFGKQSLTRSEALRDLASVTDKLSEQNRELEKNPAVKALERAARESGTAGMPSPGDLQKQMESLQKALGHATGDPDKLDKLQKELENLQKAAANMPGKDAAAAAAAREQMSQALSELSKQARELGASLPGLDEAIAALQANQTDLFVKDLQNALTDLEKLKQMAKAMQQLQQQAARLGKDLAEQLKNGQAQAAQSTLQKMIEQLQSANLSPEQLQKMIEEVSQAVEPASPYGKVGDLLKNAARQMPKGEKQEAARNLAAAAQELEKLMQQMADAEALEGTLDALERAQLAIASGRSWGECRGRGGLSRGGRPGSGVGTWGDDNGWFSADQTELVDNSGFLRPDMDPRGHTDRPDDLNPNLAPTKVRGQMSPGRSMPSITLKGVSIKGTSNVKYEEAAAAAQSEAQQALNQDQVPRAYQNAVRDYFDDLKK